jgi:hypothetical protein
VTTTTTARRFIAVAAAATTVAFGSVVTTHGFNANAAQKGTEGAGGKAVAHYAGGKTIHRSKLPSSRLFRVGLPAGEPTVGVTNEDNVYYVAIQTNTRVEVLKSANQGAKWEIVSPKLPNGRNAQLLTFDPYIWIDDTEGADRIFTIDLTVACAYLSYSDDEAKTWVTNPLACGRAVNDHQTLFGGPPKSSPTVGYPNIVYYCWNDVATSSCSKSLDGGITFHPTGTPAFLGPDVQEQASCGGLHGHGYVDQKGNVYLPRGYCGQPYVSISRDEGVTWEQHQVAKNGVSDHEMSVATDPKGNIYITWIGPDRLPYLAISKNDGKRWSKPMMIGSPGVNEANLPSLDVGGVGKVAIAYMGSENSPGMNKKGEWPNQGGCSAITSCPDGEEYDHTTWNGYMTVSTNALSKSPVFYSATVNDKKDPIKRGRCGPGRCGTTVYDFIDLVIAPDGQVWSAWVDACTTVCVDPRATSDGGNDGVVGTLTGINLR